MNPAKLPVCIVIMAGGQGARFWPMSRMKSPKQFLSINANGESLIQATSRRVEALTPQAQQMIVTNILHEPLIRQHVPNAQVISEPIGRNTAASIGLGAIHIMKKHGDGVMIVLPADHAVKNEDVLRSTLQDAVSVAANESLLVTIGIPPASPHTGYGYIKRGAECAARAYHVNRFFEKPSFERAEKYLESGDYYWNSGMFVWRASVILRAIEEFLPELHAGLERIRAVIGTPAEPGVVKEVFESLESISIDFGILEHARNCAVVEAGEFGWNDVGAWDAWAAHFDRDADGNLLRGDVLAIDSKNCVVHSEQKLIAVVGVDDLVIIDSGDALLVCPRSQVQEVRKVVEALKRAGRMEFV